MTEIVCHRIYYPCDLNRQNVKMLLLRHRKIDYIFAFGSCIFYSVWMKKIRQRHKYLKTNIRWWTNIHSTSSTWHSTNIQKRQLVRSCSFPFWKVPRWDLPAMNCAHIFITSTKEENGIKATHKLCIVVFARLSFRVNRHSLCRFSLFLSPFSLFVSLSPPLFLSPFVNKPLNVLALGFFFMKQMDFIACKQKRTKCVHDWPIRCDLFFCLMWTERSASRVRCHLIFIAATYRYDTIYKWFTS